MRLPDSPVTERPTHVRYGVLGFACSLAVLTYLDRVCIMRLSQDIRYDLGFSKRDMGLVFLAFGVGYGLCEVPAGWMGDVWGSRRVLTRIVVGWSLFTTLTGLVFAVPAWPLFALYAMLLVRFLFGCGEAGAFPNITRVVGAWFPYGERGAAQGAIWMSARLGAFFAPVLTGQLALAFGWRPAFWVYGLLGCVWCALFYPWFRNRPEDKPSCNAAERALIRAGPHSWKADEAAGAHPQVPWRAVLSSVSVWAVCVAGAAVSFAWYFFPTWQPQYLEDVFGIAFKDSEWLTGLPFLCGAGGALVGGPLSDWLVRVTGSRRWGRSLIGAFGFFGAGVCVLASGLAAQAWQAVTLLCLASFINDLAIPPIWAAAADIGGRYAGTVSGFMNMAGSVGAALGPALTPILLEELPQDLSLATRWLLIFSVYAAAWFVAAAAWLLVDASRPIVPPPGPATTTGPLAE